MAEKRRYELVLIVDPRLDEQAITATIDRFVGIITGGGGEAINVDHWGRRKLAYEIKHLEDGYYILADVVADPETMTELDRVLKLADEVMRHRILRPEQN